MGCQVSDSLYVGNVSLTSSPASMMALRLIVSLTVASDRFHLTSRRAIAQKLLNFMNEKNIKSTFFVVGSRALEYPQLLVEEYMAGHEISVHTWAHPVRRFTAKV